MDPRRFLDLAGVLHNVPGSAPEEASRRGACGRAYYASFGYAADLLRGLGYDVPDTGEAHAFVAATLKESSDGLVRSAGDYLTRLHRNRNSADYDVGRIPPRKFPFDSDTSEWAVDLARRVVTYLQERKSNDPPLGLVPSSN